MSVGTSTPSPDVGKNPDKCETCDRVHIGNGRYHCNDCHTTIKVDEEPTDNMYGSTAEPTKHFTQ